MIKIENLDKEPVILPFGSFFYLWCCDCRLRHIVFVDKESDDTAIVGLIRDDVATENRRKLDKVVCYRRGQKKCAGQTKR